MRSPHSVRKVAVTMNGISIAYVLGFVNAVMAVVNSFGLSLTDLQRVSIVSLVNAAMVLAIHLGHRLGEVQAAGGSGRLSRAQTAEIVGEATPTAAEKP